MAILVGAGVGFLAGGTNEHTVTSVSTYTTSSMTTTTFTATHQTTTTSTAISTVRSTATAPSLELFGSVSPPVITSSQNVSLNLGVFNPLPTAVRVNVTAWSAPYNGITLPCGEVSGRPDFWAIFSGHVTFSNLSSVKSLLLYNASMPLLCFRPYNSTFTFQPDSDEAYAECIACQSILLLTMSHTYNYSGYWVPSSNGNYIFQAFPPGQYTVFYFDVWGQQLLEYFAVSP